MSKQPTERTPNTALRQARLRLNMSQDDLARALREAGWASCERRTVQRYESGAVTQPQYTARRALTRVLKTPWDSLGFPPQASRSPERACQQEPTLTAGDVTNEADQTAPGFGVPSAPPTSEGADEMRRRTFALGMATAGLSAAGLSAVDATASAAEALRHGLLASTPDASPATELQEWETIVSEHAVRHLHTPPAVLLRSYLNDLQQLNLVLSARDRPVSPDLYRVGAVLTSLTAWTYGNLNSVEQAGRWWRTAHRLAAASLDPHTRVWVSAQEAVMALYQGSHSVDTILNAIQQAEPLTASIAYTPATAWLYCGKAQALGMAGRGLEAEGALRALRATFAGLDSSVTNDRVSFLGWPETRLRYTESFTYSHLGNYVAASEAQDRSLGLFTPSIRRDPVKVELQRALCLARTGAFDDAASHATTHLTSLDEGQHDLPMADLASRVLRSLPASRVTDETAELRRYVATRPLAITA